MKQKGALSINNVFITTQITVLYSVHCTLYSSVHTGAFLFGSMFLWIQIHQIWILIQNVGPIWILIQGYVINLK